MIVDIYFVKIGNKRLYLNDRVYRLVRCPDALNNCMVLKFTYTDNKNFIISMVLSNNKLYKLNVNIYI